MVPRNFFEDTSLYQKLRVKLTDENRNAVDIPGAQRSHRGVTVAALKLACPICRAQETFRLLDEIDHHEVAEYLWIEREDTEIYRLTFECQACNQGRVHYFVEFNVPNGYIKKVGQEPGLPIAVDKRVEQALGDSLYLYTNGKICENYGLGIAAFAYYRRLVEMKIDQLLSSLSEVMNEEDADTFRAEVESAKNLGNTAEKIRILASKLPKSVFIAGNNPLTVLYRALSEGLHNEPDEKCLDLAKAIRVILEHIYKQIEEYRNSQRELKDALSKLQ
jgi:hypothetical protein